MALMMHRLDTDTACSVAGSDTTSSTIRMTFIQPERWLDGSEEQVVEMKRNLELLFGYGRFKCLGQNVAMMEMPKAII